MNKLVSRNPILRFKEGKKILKGKDGLGKSLYYYLGDNGIGIHDMSLGINDDKRLTHRYIFKGKQYGSFDGGKLYYDLSSYKPLNFKSNLVLLNAINRRNPPKSDGESDGETGNGSKGTKGKVTTIKPATLPSNMQYSGRMGGWNRNIGLGTIDDAESNRMLTEMGWQGLTAELVLLKLNKNNIGGWGVVVDNKWGNQSRTALKGYYDRWNELKKQGIEKTELFVSPYQIMLQNQSVLLQPSLSMPEYRTYNDYTASDFSNRLRGLNINSNESLRNWMNTTGVQNYDWKGNNWARQLRSDVDRALNGDYSDANIRNTFGTQGNWGKGFLGRGDFGDFQKVLQTNAGTWNGIYDARLVNLVKNMDFSKLFKHKQGGTLLPKDPVERFKQRNFTVTTLKTGGNIPIYKKGSKAYATNSKYLKIANELGLYSKNDVKAYLRKLGIKDDGIWGLDTLKAYNNKFSSKTVSPVLPQQAGIITSSNPSKTYKPWRPTEEVGVVGACGTENCSEWANKSLKRHKDFKGRFLYANDEVGGDAWTRLSAGKHAKMVYSGYDGMNYDPNKYDYNLALLRNWQAALNLYDNFDSKTLDKNKTYLVNMYYNGSSQTENAWRNATNGTTGTHTGNLYWNPDTNSWRVAHNIHNKLYDDDFIKIQGVRKGKYQYGVTAIAEAPMTDYTRKDWNEAHPIKAAINRIYDFGMWKEGGKLKKKLIPKALYGTELPEVTVTAIDVNKHAGSPQHRKFIRALNSNRNEFMKKYKLSDLQYGDLSKFALNLTGAESSNGYDRNVFKRTYIYPDWVIHLGKLWKRGKDSANSRGLTQIKYDDDIKNPNLQKYYIDLGITGRNIKYDPNSMAKATLGRTLWILDLLKKQYGDLPIHYADGTEMPQEIAQYLYWNRGKVTDRANGNPETGSTTGAANLIKYYNSRKNI